MNMGSVRQEMKRYGLDSSGQSSEFLDAYFGEGMRGLWRNGASAVSWEGRNINLPQWIGHTRRTKVESLFYIPAQRVLALRDGWPRPFTDYKPGDPFVVREFSEKLPRARRAGVRYEREPVFPRNGG